MAQQALQIEHGYTDWRRMLEAEPLDAVVVSTPHHAHVEPTLATLERGLHVLVDKPMALTSAEAWTMVEAAKADRVLMVSGSRIAGKWQMVKQQIEAGLIGRVQQIDWAVSSYRRWFWESEGIPADTFALFDTIGLPREFYAEWQDWHFTRSDTDGRWCFCRSRYLRVRPAPLAGQCAGGGCGRLYQKRRTSSRKLCQLADRG